MASLKEIRARIAAQQNKKSSNDSADGPVYPHWKIEDGQTAILRFLEDGNTKNPDFWVERAVFKLPFNGIKGDPTAQNVEVHVPCMEMYHKDCAVLKEVRTWFKDDSMKPMGRKYWKKRSYIYQGFVHDDPMKRETPENPIRRFMITPQIHNLIESGMMDPEIEDLPTDMIKGLDFKVNKQIDAEDRANYTTSSWARRESALTEVELEAIEKFGLSDLSQFLPNEPSAEVQKIIFEMFEASVDGEQYDPEKWGAYYTPYGMEKTGDNTAAKVGTPAPVVIKIAEPVASTAPNGDVIDHADTSIPFDPNQDIDMDTPPATTPQQNSAAILAAIRNRPATQQ